MTGIQADHGALVSCRFRVAALLCRFKWFRVADCCSVQDNAVCSQLSPAQEVFAHHDEIPMLYVCSAQGLSCSKTHRYSQLVTDA